MGLVEFLSNILATIIGGMLLAILFFWARESIFKLPELTGKWYFQITTKESAYKPYEGMILRYMALCCREGNRIEGTVEKIYENSSTGEREFVGKNRTRGYITGYIEKNYFSKDKVFIHIVENGHGRESTNFYKLIVLRSGKMKGEFMSMVADQIGVSEWQRNIF